MTFDTPCGIAKGAGFGLRINHLCISARRPSSVRTSGEDSRRHVERVKTSKALACLHVLYTYCTYSVIICVHS